MPLTGVEVTEVVVAVVKTLVLRVPALTGKGTLLLIAALLELLFPAQSVAAWLEIFLPLPFAWPNALAWGTYIHFPGGARQLILDECFDFFLIILL
jgi:hypothetical protein